MGLPATETNRPATTADLLALPDRPRHEVIAGNLIRKALPNPRHGFVQSEFSGELRSNFRRRGGGRAGGWWFGSEIACELTATDTVLPDLAGWRLETLPAPPDGPVCRVRPDWVCEILSPSNPQRDLRDKLHAYHRGGVPWYWVVDPERRLLTVHRFTDEGYLVEQVFELGPAVRARPFDAAALDLSLALPDVDAADGGDAAPAEDAPDAAETR